MDWIATLLTWRNLISLIDILVIWLVIYELMVLLKGTRAVQLFKGILIIIVIKLISWYVGLSTVSWVMDQVINWGVIAMVIIFQPEIRRGLEHLGRGTMLTRNRVANQAEEEMIKQLDQAIQYMSKRRIGALIAIQMETGLEEYIETGIPLDAEITGALLINTFIPNTPLHDGAVIIKNNRVAVAAAYLPLSDSKLIPKELGTRHRAAVGISEVTDALTIVISEETGEVSLTKDNELLRNMSQKNYLKFLRAQLYKEEAGNRNLLTDLLTRFKGVGK
ncbi:diadenylate cyclase CdaA [Limosilactobacillus ingluviei]|uniref:Diadenylate cyclase n=1 Tax=Limosilactobacillus ingluviei TaxID=148604 RepID=A0A0R2H3J1_9LACO|nr:diadenylate cyclase CdaA [Limosilactobacillus ingluviei]KRN45077.1 TIGR00159 family protein [Limosilactobacillus ingluviei]MBM6728038.1 TIGR00159 family protein [Limosilactobacillus ingluviei]MDO4603399.1 diadenylate cyclase CdaA [Limosilactobacillus ingluviei]HJG49441.1 diadenylate cyclase CdaA [Limosilactobacillus ingluviei]